ncbi:testis-specific Y-encoded-like protein 5 [Phodopus roborovskii]|uniref:Testis-specific Y-encoded-like protein 5 n=1 Tax=Phodopus roborovskii TaxID=109678 RepID=A0AAV0A0Z4_PHORO|nr:testis-specific Y-encoded-like protein 5 [Phodopus roborovskii]CAH7117265.1 Tspyl5 [Phodopus roborovskii]
MSGRSRGRRSSRAKSRGKGRARPRVRAAEGDAWRDAKSPEGPQLEEDTAAEQVQAGAAQGGSEPAELGDDAVRRLPLDCGLALRARAAGERGLAATDPGLERATSLAERLATDTSFVGTVGALARLRHSSRLGNRRVPGRKAPDSRSAAGRGPQAIVSGKPKMGTAGPCVAVPVGEERKVAEKHAGSGSPVTIGSMDTLETVQLKLETMNAQADRAYLRLSRKFGQLRLHHLERRNLLIQSIPGFWGQAFQNHPQLSTFLNTKDKEVLSYLNRLEVEELGLARLGYKIKFYFGRNPYFQNKVLVKEYGCGPSGQVVSRSAPIQWLPGHDLQSLSKESPENNGSFFGWFSNHSSIESDKIVEIINEDLWPNPLQYYLISEEARGEKGKEERPGPAKQPVETTEPGAKQPN